MAQRICGVPDCGKKHHARGYCAAHYQRLKTTGAIDGAELCAVEECGKRCYARGHCHVHYERLRRSGTVELAPRVRKTCTFEDCGRPAVSRGLCHGHAQQAKKGKPLAPLRPMHRSTIRDEHGLKRCHACKTWQEVTEFYPKPKTADGLSSTCRRCDRSIRIRRNYGITLEQYEAMLAEQDGGCAICGTAPEDGRALHIDHDHACCPTRKKSCGKCVRGLLCEDCNRVLGTFADHIPRFEAAIDYLKNGAPRHG